MENSIWSNQTLTGTFPTKEKKKFCFVDSHAHFSTYMPRYTEEFEGLVQGNDHRPLLSFLVESQVITLTCCDWNNKIALLPCVHTKRCICCPNTLPPRFCGAANQVLRRGKGFAARQRLCGAAKVLVRGKFRGTASFARGASEFIHNHGRHYEHCMSLPVVEEGETSECPSFMGSWEHSEPGRLVLPGTQLGFVWGCYSSPLAYS